MARKIALCGKANTGKNSTANLIADLLHRKVNRVEMLAFADPIKEMLLTMFPWAEKECLYGSSHLRNKVIPRAFNKQGEPLTYRQVLIDLGRQGREYDEDHWVRVYDHRATAITAIEPLVICTDVRYRNEFAYLKGNQYFLIKLFRQSDMVINDSSETSQDQIKNGEFDAVLDNNGNLNDLKERVQSLVKQIEQA